MIFTWYPNDFAIYFYKYNVLLAIATNVPVHVNNFISIALLITTNVLHNGNRTRQEHYNLKAMKNTIQYNFLID